MSRPQDITHETKNKTFLREQHPSAEMRCETGSCEMFSFALFFGFHDYFKGCGAGLVDYS